MSTLMTGDKRNELFGVAELSNPYAYADLCTSSVTPWVLLLPTIQSPTDESLSWAGLAPVEEGNGKVCVEGSLCQQLPPTLTPPPHSYKTFYCKTFSYKIFKHEYFPIYNMSMSCIHTHMYAHVCTVQYMCTCMSTCMYCMSMYCMSMHCMSMYCTMYVYIL